MEIRKKNRIKELCKLFNQLIKFPKNNPIKEVVEMKANYLELVLNKNKELMLRLVSSNGRILLSGTSETYESRRNAMDTKRSIIDRPIIFRDLTKE